MDLGPHLGAELGVTGHELVHGRAAARPREVVVDHDPPARHDPRGQPAQAGRRGVVPVAVHVGQRHRAGAIDVIPDVVYRYRAREDQSSISQQTASLQDLRQRIEAWRVSRDVLTAEASPALFEAWRLTLFDVHFHWYLTSTGTVDDDYWSELVAAVRELTEGAPRGCGSRRCPAAGC